MDDAERDNIQDALDEEGREGGVREGGVADETDEAVRELDLPGEEVAMTSRGVGRAGPAPRAPRPELDRARREKRAVGQAAMEVPDTGREKRARQTTIDEMYAREKLAEFTDVWLQWINVKKLPFNAFHGPEIQRVRQAAERVPRSIQFRFPSYRVTAGAGIASQSAKVATMVREVRATFGRSGATILSDGRKSRSGKPLVNFLAGGDNGTLLYATVARDGEFWQRVQYAILVMSPVHQLLRRMDRGRMMMSVVYEWSQHLLHLMRRVDVLEDMIQPCLREVAIRNLHMLEPAHAATHLLNPCRRSLTYYHSLQTTTDDRRVVEECDRFLLAQTGGDPIGLLYRSVRNQMRAFHSRRGDWGDRNLSDAEAADCKGDSETERCATWWFEHGPERNWAEHERLSTARRCKLGFAKLAQLVEIATNLKLASCARQGGGYVLPWVMGSGHGGTAAEEEDEEGDVEPEVWGARPDGSVLEQEIQRQIVAFRDSGPSRARSVRDLFGSRATELRPWPEGGEDVDAAAVDDDIDDDWTDDDDTPLSRDPTAERVYFTYGGGRDGMDSFTSVIIGDVSSTTQASGSSRADGSGGGRSHSKAAEGGSGRPSLRMAGRVLGLSRAETRRSLVLEAPGTSTDRLREEQFTSGDEGLLMRPGTRRQHDLSEVEARLAARVAAGQAALDAIQRETERGIVAQVEEDEDADTELEPIETAARRHRAHVAAATTAADAAYVSGARGTGAGGRGGRRGGPHGRPSSGRGRARSGGR
ncbi:hypothetical protein CBR_g8721 [Chara braunii]|uniref:DUF659 domain-containing protein n=1 Tax=Chara braunii TaxID=69332 RepID=A0A388KMM4_CHABU|nr:hypothetical protein CBR_g8721 [Chara braunii]|eukprot:GBG71300.1 hypothetical protein CBR_g8721 [Chara braunii]